MHVKLCSLIIDVQDGGVPFTNEGLGQTWLRPGLLILKRCTAFILCEKKLEQITSQTVF